LIEHPVGGIRFISLETILTVKKGKVGEHFEMEEPAFQTECSDFPI
jgi:hypothetical protein